MKNFRLVAMLFMLMNGVILCMANVGTNTSYRLYFNLANGSLFLPLFLLYLMGIGTGIAIVWWLVGRKNNPSSPSVSNWSTNDMDI